MAQIFISYNPYKLETNIKVNGKNVAEDSSLFKIENKIVKGKRLC